MIKSEDEVIYKYTYYITYYAENRFSASINSVSVSRIEKIISDKDVFALSEYLKGEYGHERVVIINWRRVKHVPD